ncbi:hypothetical protein ACSFCX_24040 [Yokenella regensburgei]|uniref:hypothetical protein n=1 Tax=Yokenella regensburgei TaxID=158877 RepID=UPI003ED8F36C
MNDHSAIAQLDKAIIDLNQLFESCNKKFENQVWEILQTVCNAKESITNNRNEVTETIKKAPQAKNVPRVIENYVFDALLAVRKLETLSQITHESFFKAEDEEDQLCSMFSVMWDYANEVGAAIRNIKQEIK